MTNGEVTERQYCDLINEEERAKPRGERDFTITCKSKAVDPAHLADYALDLVQKDRKASERGNGGTSDSYSSVFLVVDVDDLHVQNPKSLRDAQRTCDDNGMHLVISDPCFEVWLIDHVMVCPPHITTQGQAEALAKSEHLTTGRNNKFLVPEKLRDRIQVAVRNAYLHNNVVASKQRKSLQGKSFAPWTDFPDLVRYVDAQ